MISVLIALDINIYTRWEQNPSTLKLYLQRQGTGVSTLRFKHTHSRQFSAGRDTSECPL